MAEQQRKQSSKPLPVADREFAVSAFRRMAFIRAFEQRCWELSVETPPAIIGTLHFCAGQEAIPVGAMAALTPRDRVSATYRGHGWVLECCPDPLEVFAELCHRDAGLNGGRAGSAYMSAPQHRFMGENSIVAGGVPIACGLALAALAQKERGVVLVSFGDGAMSQGALHESLVMASYRALPVIFLCEHNGWSELTPTAAITNGKELFERVAGYGIPAAVVDGCDPMLVRDAVAAAAEHARRGAGPMFLECRTIRLWGHYHRDLESYRPKSDRAHAERLDPLPTLAQRLVDNQVLTQIDVDTLLHDTKMAVQRLAERALALPEPDPATARLHVNAPPAAAAVISSDVRVKQLRYIEAVNEALRAELASRPEVLVYGEDVGRPGGIFGASRNLQREFGAERVFDTPIAESAILGSALGAAMMGMRPVVEIMYADFLFVAFDQIINQASNFRYLTRGAYSAPLVVRMQQGATPGSCAQHSQSIEALLAHIPGLRIGLPATPQDAYQMLRAAIADSDPCVIIEARALYQMSGPVRLDESAGAVGGAVLRRDGRDAAIVTWSTCVGPSLEAAAALADSGIDVAVLDLRWLVPLDDDALQRLAMECDGRVLIVHEANITGGFGAEVLARLTERCAGHFQALHRLGSPDIRMPASPTLQKALLPDAPRIVEAIRRLMQASP